MAMLLAVADDLHFVVRVTVIGLTFCASILSVKEIIQQRTIFDLHISGAGDLTLTPVTENDNGFLVGKNPHANARWLARGSLITPILLVLRLADNCGDIKPLLIFPDSVSNDVFRRLSVACRWLATRKEHHQDALLK